MKSFSESFGILKRRERAEERDAVERGGGEGDITATSEARRAAPSPRSHGWSAQERAGRRGSVGQTDACGSGVKRARWVNATGDPSTCSGL
ncbi:unnamed protein product [Tetraodon nigroviridis]|uniref:(spotted green pufferfish) hypothetical protein n=1 Tax=Tetraodon nigroviridis TaxID=99883 RepID=Q4SPK7_TETNG|nr:unnamed protein product [Tetraodon nigroviridis]